MHDNQKLDWFTCTNYRSYSSSGIYIFIYKKQQIETDECRLKEKYYLNHIEEVSNITLPNNSKWTRNQLENAQR